MTLLVLNLQPPEMAQPTDPSVFSRVLAGQLPGFVSWLLSFAILCRLWTVHHDLLADGDTRSRGFVSWNFVFLGAVSFIPYPTALLAEHPEQLLSVLFFSSTYVVAGFALGRMRHFSDVETGSQYAEPAPPGASHAMLLIVATACLSCLLALIDPRLGAMLWFSYPITGGLVRQHDRWSATRDSRTKRR